MHAYVSPASLQLRRLIYTYNHVIPKLMTLWIDHLDDNIYIIRRSSLTGTLYQIQRLDIQMASKKTKTNGSKSRELSEELRNRDGYSAASGSCMSRNSIRKHTIFMPRNDGIFIVHVFLVGFSAPSQPIGSSLDILKVTQNNELKIFNKSYIKI